MNDVFENFSRVSPQIEFADPHFEDRLRILYGKPVAPLQASYAPEVDYIRAAGNRDSGPTNGVSDWLKLAQEEWRKFPPRVPPMDLDAMVSRCWNIYEASRTVPKSNTKADQFRWWLRCKLVDWKVI